MCAVVNPAFSLPFALKAGLVNLNGTWKCVDLLPRCFDWISNAQRLRTRCHFYRKSCFFSCYCKKKKIMHKLKIMLLWKTILEWKTSKYYCTRNWERAVKHVQKNVNEYMENDVPVYEFIDSFVTNFTGTSSDEESL